MKNKKYSVRLGIAALATALLLTSCGGGSASSTAASSAPESTASSVIVEAESAPASSVAEEPASSDAASESSSDDVHVIDGVTFIVREVPNDHTGNWRYASLSESFDMSEHALEYYTQCFGSDSEVHFIINDADQTTTRLNYAAGYITVTVKKKVEDAIFDATSLGDGDVIAEYYVNKETGEIETE